MIHAPVSLACLRRLCASFRGAVVTFVSVATCVSMISGCGDQKPASTPASKPADAVSKPHGAATNAPPKPNVEANSKAETKAAAPQKSGEPKISDASKGTEPPAAANEWRSLFDGKSLEGWKATDFGGEGEVHVEDGSLVLDMGNDLTGVTITREVPRMNYEVELQAMRVDGSDFFCGLTFPVKDDPCSLIVGGWGGGVCGLSSLDGFDASENETTSYKEFKTGQWYPVRLRVTEQKIEAWLDGERIVDVETKGRRISVRSEVERSRPFGLACWRTKAALRDIRVRQLPPAATK